MNKMYNLDTICWICLRKNDFLQHLSDKDSENLTYYIKLTISISEMCFKEMNDQKQICKECCDTIDIVYNFRQKCIKTKNVLIDYISKLHSKNINSGISSGELGQTEIKLEEVFIKTECESDEYEEDKEEKCSYNFSHMCEVKSEMETEEHSLADNEDNKSLLQNYIESKNIKCENNLEEKTFSKTKIIEDLLKQPKIIQETEEHSLADNEDNKSLLQNYIESKNIKCENNLEEKIFSKTKIIEDLLKQPKIIQEASSSKTPPTRAKLPASSKICEICQKTFPSVSKKNIHMRTHTGERLYICNICNKKFTQTTHLAVHMRIHTGAKPYDCNECDKKFRHLSTLRAHKKMHAVINTGEKLYECIICHKKFSVACNMRTHMRTHTGEKPFECTICNKKIGNKSNLTEHMRTHTGESPFECNVCKKRFKQTGALNKHMRIHTGERPHECNICNRKFTQKDTLNVHMKTHTGDSPLKCNICMMRFKMNSTLTKHMKIHAEQRLFQCDICSESFAQKDRYIAHIKTHGTEPLECVICETKYSNNVELQEHVEEMHTSVE